MAPPPSRFAAPLLAAPGSAPSVVTVYHGAPTAISGFDPAFLGSGAGHHAEGPGFYLTSDPLDAAMYASASPSGALLTCEVSVNALVPTTRHDDPRMVEWLITSCPDLAERLEDWGEDPRTALQTAVPAYQQKESAHESFQSLWYDFYREREPEYLERLVALGYTGVISEKSAAAHLIVFDPAAIRIIGRMPAADLVESPAVTVAAETSRLALHELAARANEPVRHRLQPSAVRVAASRPRSAVAGGRRGR